MPKTLKLVLLSLRDLIVSIGPVVFVVIGLLIAAYWWLDPQPPRRVTLATGPAAAHRLYKPTEVDQAPGLEPLLD